MNFNFYILFDNTIETQMFKKWDKRKKRVIFSLLFMALVGEFIIHLLRIKWLFCLTYIFVTYDKSTNRIHFIFIQKWFTFYRILCSNFKKCSYFTFSFSERLLMYLNVLSFIRLHFHSIEKKHNFFGDNWQNISITF